MIHAVKNGQAVITSYLLRYGAEFNEADSSNNTPLHYAAAFGFYECMDLLIKCGSNINANNIWKITPCSIALSCGHVGILDFLLKVPGIITNFKDL